MKKDPAIICVWVCLGLAAAGVGTHFWMSNRLEKAKKDTPQALKVLEEIATARADIAFLNGELEQDQFRDTKDQFYAFFEEMGKLAGNLPGPKIDPPDPDTPAGAKGYEDRRFNLKWAATGRDKTTFTREQVGTFCYNIETHSKLVKVTDIDLRAADTKTWDDRWTLTMSVTERRPTSAPATP